MILQLNFLIIQKSTLRQISALLEWHLQGTDRGRPKNKKPE